MKYVYIIIVLFFIQNVKATEIPLPTNHLFSTHTLEHEKIINTDNDDTLKILSWNIHMLPYFIYYKSKKRIRAKQIVNQMYERDYHIIVFQEVFHRRVRNKLARALKKKYPYQYGPANKKRLSLKTNSGIWVVSDRPLSLKATTKFEVATELDNKWARKGAMLFEGEFNGNIFQLIGTHTQGNPRIINNHQFHQIYDELIEPHHEEDVPVIICGDMNCQMKEKKDYNQMLKILHIENPEPMVDARPEKKGNIVKRTIDYIFVRKNKSKIKVAKKRKLLIGPDWKQGGKKIYLETVGLSDHYPIDISLTW